MTTTMSTSGQDACFAPDSFYNTDCGVPGDFYYGCFYPNPCISAISAATAESSSVFLKFAERAPLPACPSGYTYYDTTCGDNGYVKGCLNEEPCGRLDNNDPLSVVPTIGVPQLMITSFPAAATSTLTIILTNSARTRTAIFTLSTSSSNSRLNPSTSLPGSQTAAVTSASSTLAQAATPVAAVSSASLTSPSTLPHSTNPVAAVASSSAKSSSSPSPSHGDTTAVAAGTAGAVVGAFIALIIMLRVLKWRKRRTEKDPRTSKQDTEEQMQDAGANRAGEPFHGEENGGIASAYRDADHTFPVYPGTSNAGNDGNNANHLNDLHPAVPPLSSIQPRSRVSDSAPDASGGQPELEVPAFHSPVELSPQSERSLINIPRQVPNSSRVNSISEGGLEQTADGPVMHPNLDLRGEVGEPSVRSTGGSHIMSWMSYDGDGYGSGPER